MTVVAGTEHKDKKHLSADQRFAIGLAVAILTILVIVIFWQPVVGWVDRTFSPPAPAPVTEDWHGNPVKGGSVSSDRAEKLIQESASLKQDACILNTEVAEVEKHFNGTPIGTPCTSALAGAPKGSVGEDSETNSKPTPETSTPFRSLAETQLAGSPAGAPSSADWSTPVGCEEPNERTVGYRNWTICLEGLGGAREEMLVAIGSQLYRSNASADGTPTKEGGTTEIDGQSFSWRVLPR